ncbi:MAG: Calx-beta domain-containing protein [Pseudomonadota bacterium]
MPTLDFTAIPGNTRDEGQILVTLSEPVFGDVTVRFLVKGQTAFGGNFVTTRTGTVTIPANQTTATLDISHFGSSDVDRIYTVEFYDPSGADFADGAQLVRVDNVIFFGQRAYSVSDPVIFEEDGVARFEVRLTQPADTTLQFDFATADATARAGEDYTARSGVLSFAPGETVKTVEVPILSDGTPEFNEAFSLVVTPRGAAAAAVGNAAGDGAGLAIIRDDDHSAVLPAISVEFAEGNTSSEAQFTLRLTEPVFGDVSVSFQVIGDSAIGGNNVTTRTGTITIPAGETSRVLEIDHFGSSITEDRVYTLELTDPVGAVFEGDQQLLRSTGVIFFGGLGLSVGDPIVDEEAGEAVFEVRLTQEPTSRLVFDAVTRDGTALAGVDYTATSETLVFEPGQTLSAVRVPLLDDDVAELNEIFSLVVTPQPQSAAAIINGAADAAGIATIRDGDTLNVLPLLTLEPAEGTTRAEGQFILRLSEPSLGDVTVTAQVIGDTAVGGVDVSSRTFTVTIPAGETARTVEISHFGGGDLDQSYTLELTDPVGAAFPADVTLLRETGVIFKGGVGLVVSDPVVFEGAEEREAVFDVRLSFPSDLTLSFDFETRDGSALAGEDYTATSGSLVFLPGQTIASVRVPLLDDGVVEGSEFFTLGLTPQAATAPAIANGFSDAEGLATLHDDDTASGLPILSVEAAEGTTRGEAQFILRLDQPSLGPVTVQVTTISDTAIVGTDVSEATTVLTIPAGQTALTLERSLFGSGSFDDNFQLEFTDPSGAVLAGDVEVLRVTGVILREERGLFVSDPVIYESDLNDSFAVFEVRLSRASQNPLSFDFTTIDGTAVAGQDYQATAGRLTFDAGQTLAAVRVPLTGDRLAEGTETFSLLVTPDQQSAPAIATGPLDSSGIATILDEDTSDVLPELSIEFAEGSDRGEIRFAVRLSEPTAQDVTFQASTLSDTAFGGNDITGFDGTTFTIPAGEQSVLVELSVSNFSSGTVDAGFELSIFNPDGAVLTGDALVATARGIVLETGLGVFVSDAAALPSTDSDPSTLDFEVRLSRPSANPLTFTFETAPVTPGGGENFPTTTGTLIFQPGQTLAVIRIPAEARLQDFDGITLTLTPDVASASAILNGAASTSAQGVLIDFERQVQGDSQGVDFLVGGNGNDLLRGFGGDDRLEGGRGNDELDGLSADDSLFGGIGEDLLIGGTGADLLDGGGSVDTASYDPSRDGVTLSLRSGIGSAGDAAGDRLVSIENVIGSRRDDRIFGDDFANILDGGQFAGDDFLSGLGGDDMLLGRSGDDDLRGGTGHDTLLGDLGNDTLQGNSGDDQLEGNGGSDRLDGGSGDDMLNGGDQRDTLLGAAGDDTLSGGNDVDMLFGGAGDDRLSGGASDDMLEGGDGDDLLLGGSGNRDQFNGGAGIDTVSYFGAQARVIADLNNQFTAGFEARFETYTEVENLIGGRSNDTLRGDDEDNRLQGQQAADRLFGRAGDDRLLGEAGNDVLYGNAGQDLLSGGTGTNRFVYFTESDSRAGATERDTITDFVSGRDRIEISRLDADLTRGGNQTFEFISSAGFSGDAGELRFFESPNNGFTLIQADLDGDRSSDFEIQLTGLIDLEAEDFRL